MHIKIKYQQEEGEIRLENSVEIKEVMIREHLMDPKKKRISIGFTNDSSSGLVEFSPEEFDRLVKSARDNTHLIKGIKVIRG